MTYQRTKRDADITNRKCTQKWNNYRKIRSLSRVYYSSLNLVLKLNYPKLLPHFWVGKPKKWNVSMMVPKKSITGPLMSTKLHMYVSKFLFKSNQTLHAEAFIPPFCFWSRGWIQILLCKPLQNLLFHNDLQSLQFQLGSKQDNSLRGIDNSSGLARSTILLEGPEKQ